MSKDDRDHLPLPDNNDGNQDKQTDDRGDKDSNDDPALPVDDTRRFLDQLPEEEQQKLVRLASLTASSHQGPLPSPEAFGEYDRIRPGSADDIMQMAK